MLFPTSMVDINWLGLLKNISKILLVRLLSFLSSSYLNLFAVINEISIPEKNAEKASEINI